MHISSTVGNHFTRTFAFKPTVKLPEINLSRREDYKNSNFRRPVLYILPIKTCAFYRALLMKNSTDCRSSGLVNWTPKNSPLESWRRRKLKLHCSVAFSPNNPFAFSHTFLRKFDNQLPFARVHVLLNRTGKPPVVTIFIDKTTKIQAVAISLPFHQSNYALLTLHFSRRSVSGACRRSSSAFAASNGQWQAFLH